MTLLAASIDQRTASLKPLPFAQAVDVRPSLRALRLALPVAALVAGVFWLRPAWVTEPATRIVQHRTEFVEPAPFRFVLTNDDLRVAAGDPLTIEVSVVGDDLPGAVMMETMGDGSAWNAPEDMCFRYTFLGEVHNSVPILGQRVAL